jgi:adenylate cyclase
MKVSVFFPAVKKFLTKSSWSFAVVGVASFLLVALFGLSPIYERFESSLYDLRFKAHPAPEVWQKLVLLDIDDSSIVNVGEFPWRRNIYADGLSVLKEVGARNFLFDIQFMDKSPRFVDREAFDSLKQKVKSGQKVNAEDVDAAAIDNDIALSAGIKAYSGTVLPYSFEKQNLYNDEGTPEAKIRLDSLKLFLKKATIPVPAGQEKIFSACVDPTRVAVHPPIPPVVESGSHFGFVDSDPEMDGYIRRIRLVRVFENRIYFHMALVAISELTGVPCDKMLIEPGKKIVIPKALNPVTLVREDISIPVDRECAMYINWAGTYEKAFNHLPYFAVLEYNAVKDGIHEWFDETEKSTGKNERSELIEKRRILREKFAASRDDAVRRNIFVELGATADKIRVIEESYVKSIKTQRDELAKAAASDASGKQELTEAENMLTAIQIVTGVDALRDSVCVSGYTANASQDVGSIPLSSAYYLVGTYPNVINTVVQKAFIHKAPRALELLIMLLFAVGIAYVVHKLNPKMALLLSVTAVILYTAIDMALFSFGNIWFDQLGVTICLALPSVAIIGVRFLAEESQKKFIKDTFSMYLSKQVVDELIKDPERIKLGGEEQDITIFFSDIKGFTSLSEKMAPTDLVNVLNEYLSNMCDIILNQRGTVDKFIGDAIMAFYGAPYHYADHALAACSAAVKMQAHLGELRSRWKKEGKSLIYARFGINSGPAVVGNMGSRDRISYTAMGDAVNLASRLEGANKYYGTYTMISETTYNAVKDDMETRFLDKIKVVGKELPINVFELVSAKGELTHSQKEVFGIYNRGIELFIDREWDKARRTFAQALKVNKDDGPSKTYHDRCAEFIIKPPSKKWDGVYTMKSK